MTFIYEEGYCTDEAEDKRLLAVASHFSYLAEDMVSENSIVQGRDFCSKKSDLSLEHIFFE